MLKELVTAAVIELVRGTVPEVVKAVKAYCDRRVGERWLKSAPQMGRQEPKTRRKRRNRR